MFKFKSFTNYKLFSKLNKKFKNIVFYSEGQEHDHFFLPFVQVCLDENIPFCYVSSEENKPFIGNNYSNFFYIGKSFIRTLFFSTLECENLITTTPDLQNFFLKKSSKCKNYIYFFHSMCSVNVIYNKNAFSHYDTILCANKFHTKEFENYYFSNKKIKLINLGYPKIDELNIKQISQIPNKKIQNILIAPTWGNEKENFLVYEKLINMLLDHNFKIKFRPHPVTIDKKMNILVRIKKKFTNNSDFSISYEKNNLNDYLWSDTIISDWSGSAIEYSLATKKPCIFIDTEQKVRNKNAKSHEKNNSFENYFRNNIGLCIEKENISDILINLNKDTFLNLSEKKIDDFRVNHLYNFQNTNSAVKKFIKSIS